MSSRYCLPSPNVCLQNKHTVQYMFAIQTPHCRLVLSISQPCIPRSQQPQIWRWHIHNAMQCHKNINNVIQFSQLTYSGLEKNECINHHCLKFITHKCYFGVYLQAVKQQGMSTPEQIPSEYTNCSPWQYIHYIIYYTAKCVNKW